MTELTALSGRLEGWEEKEGLLLREQEEARREAQTTRLRTTDLLSREAALLEQIKVPCLLQALLNR